MAESRRGSWLGAGCEIVAPDGRLLMIEQERMGLTEWSGTGGVLEEGESISDAAIRETREESGLTVRLERLISVSEFWERERLAGVGFLFLATPDPWPQEVRLPEVDGATRFVSSRWMSRAEVDRLDERWEHHISRTAWPTDIERPLVLRLDAPLGLRIRHARREEAAALTALAQRSKAHWGYPDDLMAVFRSLIVITPADVERHEVWLLEEGEAILGFHRLRLDGEPAILEDLWLDPPAIGRGHGRRLWNHAVALARAAGARAIELDADPKAAAFYEHVGARIVGETPSDAVPGRSLPRMRFALD